MGSLSNKEGLQIPVHLIHFSYFLTNLCYGDATMY